MTLSLMKKTNEERLEARKPMNAKLSAVLTGLCCALMCAALNALPAVASDAISQGINSGAEQLWNIAVAIVAPLGAVALAFCAVKIIWGGARAAEEAKNTAVKIIIGIAIVLLAPSLIGTIRGWFKGKATWSMVNS